MMQSRFICDREGKHRVCIFRMVVPLLLGMQAAWLWAAADGSSRLVSGARDDIRREMLDPCLGQRWQLVLDKLHPEWPARMILREQNGLAVTEQAGDNRSSYRSESRDRVIAEAIRQRHEPDSLLVIRAGDRVTVEQETQLVCARLQAVALDSAVLGQILRVRVGAGTKVSYNATAPVIQVVVIGPGRAQWLAAERTIR